ncbi:uncharacterized protein KY384_007818 [Bacidia gigantensis]|uniref:uncharacterized protein n=1 Tax=Bacidia gigantensis TaxID=2732470 RepID=UPI001D0493A8|nr:uncharacterized protein KY384_007818 [Bacidia gigantensis]KAG8527665.1 hypothetical protein KY384_007818 [Bacidia gigantensis]
MSDDDADPELLELLRKSLGLGADSSPVAPKIKVLEHAEFVYDNSLDVAIDMRGTKAAASKIYSLMQEKSYSSQTWRSHELHPKSKDSKTVEFIFLMDLLNFSFWSVKDDPSECFAVAYRGQCWTGYWSLVAALQRALDEGFPITDPKFWTDETSASDDVWRKIFRSATEEEMPMLEERIQCVRDAGRILQDQYDGSFLTTLEEANGSAAALVTTLARDFPCFDDSTRFEGQRVSFYKRAQILVADLWACFEGEGYGNFSDIDQVTMFAGTKSLSQSLGL